MLKLLSRKLHSNTAKPIPKSKVAGNKSSLVYSSEILDNPMVVAVDANTPKHEENQENKAENAVCLNCKRIDDDDSPRLPSTLDNVPAESPDCRRIPMPDWSKPVYWKSSADGRPSLRRVKIPMISLFTFKTIRSLINESFRETALLVLNSIESNCKSPIPAFKDLVCRIRNKITVTRTITITPPRPSTPPSDDMPSLMLTPKVTRIINNLTSEEDQDDAEYDALERDIESIVQKTPGLRESPSEAKRRIAEAASYLKDLSQSCGGRGRYRGGRIDGDCDGKGSHKKRKPADHLSEGGSSYIYSLVTPTKKMRTILQTDLAMSLVRRSQRLMDKTASAEESIIEGVDLGKVGYLPNERAISLQASPRKTLFKKEKDTLDADHDTKKLQ